MSVTAISGSSSAWDDYRRSEQAMQAQTTGDLSKAQSLQEKLKIARGLAPVSLIDPGSTPPTTPLQSERDALEKNFPIGGQQQGMVIGGSSMPAVTDPSSGTAGSTGWAGAAGVSSYSQLAAIINSPPPMPGALDSWA
jgi:hypothetical protein